MISVDQILKAKPVLSNEQVHVFLFQLNSFNCNDLLPYLSEDELIRASKLKIEQKKNQFVITRGLLRRLLSNCLEKEPGELTFSYQQHCKPTIDDKYNNKSIEFNVSHSGNYGLIAMTLENKVGIDIEETNPEIDFQSLSNRFFSDNEKKELINLDKDEQLDAFYRVWVRKESFIKAIGKGVAFGLDRFSVSLEENINTEMEVVTPESINDKWFCYDITMLDNYKTALTTCRQGIDIVISK